MSSPKRRPPPPAHVTVPRALKDIQTSTMLSALLSLGAFAEDSESRRDDGYELRVSVIKESLSIERICQRHYFKASMPCLEEPVHKPWPVLIRNLSFVVELEGNVAAMPYYLPGNLVYANLSMGLGVVGVTINTSSGVFKQRLTTPLSSIFLLDDPGTDSFAELMLTPTSWRNDRKSVAKTLTNTEVTKIARMQLAQEHGQQASGHLKSDYLSGAASHSIFEKVGEVQPTLKEERPPEDASSYKDNCVLQNLKIYLAHVYWAIQRQVHRPSTMKRALNQLFLTHASHLVYNEQELIVEDLENKSRGTLLDASSVRPLGATTSFSLLLTKRSSSVLASKDLLPSHSQAGAETNLSLLQNRSGLLKRSGERVGSVPKALPKLSGTKGNQDLEERDLTMTQLQSTLPSGAQKSPMRSQSQITHSNPLLRAPSPALPARRGHMTQTVISSTRIPLLPSTTKVDSRVIKMTQVLNAMLDEVRKDDETLKEICDDVVHDPERDFKAELEGAYQRHLSALEEEFFLSVTAAHRRFHSRLFSVTDDISSASKEHEVLVPKMGLLRPSFYTVGLSVPIIEATSASLTYESTLPLGLLSYRIPTTFIWDCNLILYDSEFSKRQSRFLSLRQSLSAQIRFQPCYITNAQPLLSNILKISETMMDIFLDINTLDLSNIHSCNLTLDKDGNVIVGSAHDVTDRKGQLLEYTPVVEQSIASFIQYIDGMIAKINQHYEHIKFFESHELFEERADYFCNMDQLHDTRKKLSIEFAALRSSEDPYIIDNLIKTNTTIFIKVLKYFLFYHVVLIPYSVILASILIYYQYLHNHVATKLEKEVNGSQEHEQSQDLADHSEKMAGVAAALAAVKIHDATRIYFTVTRMVASALNDLAERASYKVFLLALKPLKEFQFSDQGMQNISTLEDLSLIASRMYNYGFSRFDFVHNVFYTQRSRISFLYGVDQQAISDMVKLETLQGATDADAKTVTSPEESFNPDNCEDSIPQGGDAHDLRTIHRRRTDLVIETVVNKEKDENVASAQEAFAAEHGIRPDKVAGCALARGEEDAHLVSVPPVVTTIGYHYSFFDVLMTFAFNLSISVVTGINWTAVEGTHLNSLGFTYFSNYMARYPKQKFTVSMQEQNLRFRTMAGETISGLITNEDKANETQDGIATETDEDLMPCTIDIKADPTEGSNVLMLLQEDNKLIEIYDHTIADMYLDLPLVLMGNSAVIANRQDAPNTNIGDVKRETEGPFAPSVSFQPNDTDNNPDTGVFDSPPTSNTQLDILARQRQRVLSRHHSKRVDQGAFDEDTLDTYVALLTHKKLSLLTIKERGVVTRLELSDRASEFSCLLDLTQDLFSDDFSPMNLMSNYRAWFSTDKQIETLLSFDYERCLKIRDIKDLLLFGNHEQEFPLLDFSTPRSIIDKIENLRAIIAAFPDQFYASMITVSVKHMRENLLEALDYLEKHMMNNLTEAIECFTKYILAELKFVSSLILSATTTPEKFQLVRDLHNKLSSDSARYIFSSLYDKFVLHYGANYISLFPITYEKHLLPLLEEPSRQFMKLSMLAKKHSQSISSRINAYADYVSAVDNWIAQIAFSIADGLKVIFTIDYPSFREARNAPLTFAEKYPTLCKNFELKLLTLDDYHSGHDRLRLDPFSSEQDASLPDSQPLNNPSSGLDPSKSSLAQAGHKFKKNIVPVLRSSEAPNTGTLEMSDTSQIHGEPSAFPPVPDESLAGTSVANTQVFERDFLQSLAVACRFELHTKRISHSSLLKGFRETDGSETANNQRIICLRNNVPDSLSSKVPGHKYIFSTTKLYKRPVRKPTAPYQRNAEKYDMRRILSEYKFILMELCSLIRLLDRWRVYLLAAECSTKLLEIPVYPSPFEMLKILAPIADVSITLFDIDSCHNHYSERTLRSYPHVELLMAIDRVAYGIRQARKFAQEKFVDIHSNKVDILHLTNKIMNGRHKGRIHLTESDGSDPPFMARIKEMPDVAFSVSFDPWTEYLDNAENVLLLFVPPVTLLHQVSSDSLRPIHLQRITSLTGVFVEKTLSVKPQLLLDAFEKNNELLDFVLVLVQNASIDKQALQELKQIERALYSIRIDRTYALSIGTSNFATNDKSTGWKSAIDFAIITPANAEEICREALVTISLVLNNLGYTGTRHIDYAQSFDVNLAHVASKSSILTARYLSEAFDAHRQYLQQWRYTQNVEEYARDLEALAQLMLFLITIFKRMPFVLQDLLTYQVNANLIDFKGPQETLFTDYHKKIVKDVAVSGATPSSPNQWAKRFGGAELTEAERTKLATRLKAEQRKKAFAVNVLSKQDVTTLQAACAAWKDVIAKYCSVEEVMKKKSLGARILRNISTTRSMSTSVPFLCVVINMNILKNLSKHMLEVDAIHKRLHFYQDFAILQAFQDLAAKNPTIETFSPYYSVKTSNPEILSIGPRKLIPWCNRKHFPSALFCSSVCQVFCGAFPLKKSLFKLVSSLSYEVFNGMDEYITDSSSIRGTIINGIRSVDETLMFTTPVEAPDVMYLVPDAVTVETRASFVDAVKKAWDEFAVAYMKFTGKGLRGEAPPEGFFTYLHLEQIAQSVNQSAQSVGKKAPVNEELEKNKQKLASSPMIKDPDGFSNYLKTNLFRAVIIAMSTWLLEKTRGLLFRFALSKEPTYDDLPELLSFFQNLLLAAKINTMQKNPVYVKTFIQHLIDWYEYFQDIQGVLQSGDPGRILSMNNSITFTVYNPAAHNLYVTSSLSEFVVPYGPHWIGAPTPLDIIATLPLQYRYAITSVINGFSMGIPVFLLTAANRSIYVQEPAKLTLQVCHLLGRRMICACVAEFTFVKCLQRITACLCAGYVVVVFGVQYLPTAQILELVELSNSLRRKAGPLETLCVTREISAAEKKKAIKSKVFFGSSEMNYVQSQVAVKIADFADFSDHGLLIFHLPELAPIITADRFFFAHKEEEGENSKSQTSTTDPCPQADNEKPSRIQDNYSATYYLTEHGKNCIAAFKHAEIVHLEFDQPESSFKKVSPEYYHTFCELNNFLASMGPLSCKLLTSDIQMIYNRAKDKSDTSCVAAVTLDYVLRQTGRFLSLKATRHELRSLTSVYSQFVCAAFGLDKMNSMYIGRLARNFLGTIESARVHLGLKYAEVGDAYAMDKAKNAPIKQVSFLKYYTDSLSRYLSQQFQWYINMFSQAHQLSLQTVYDVLLCNDLLRSFKPVLVVVPQISYLKTFASIIAAVRGWRMHYCFNATSVYSAHKDIQALDLSDNVANDKITQEHLIVIAPSNVSAFLQMFEIIISISLGFPVLTDDKNLSQIQVDITHGPHYLIVISPSFLPDIINYPLIKAICHRLILLPSIEGADGSKKICQGSLHIDEAHLFSLVHRNHALWKRDLDAALEGMEHVNQYGDDSSTPLSAAIEHVVTNYRSILLHSSLKDRLLKTAEKRISALPTFVKGVVSFYYDVITKIFGYGRSIEEVYLLRSIMYFNLCRNGVVTPRKRRLQNDFLKDICLANDKFDQNTASACVQRISEVAMGQRGRDINAMTRIIGAQYITTTQMQEQAQKNKQRKTETAYVGNLSSDADALQIKRKQLFVLGNLMQSRVRVSDDLYPFSEIAGFSKESLISLEAQMKKLTAEAGNTANVSEIINHTVLLNAENDIVPFGMGFQGSMSFSFAEKYLHEAFFHPKRHMTAFTNICTPFFCAIWNACSLFYLTFTASSNWERLLAHGPKTAHDLLSKRYVKTIGELSEFQKVSQGTFCSMIAAIVLILSEADQPPASLKKECLANYTVSQKLSLAKLNHGLTNEQLMTGIRSTMQEVTHTVPKYMSDDTFSYLDYKFGINKEKKSKHYNHFHARVEFRTYRVGEGLLNNITLDADKVTLEKNLLYVAEKTLHLRRKQVYEAQLNKSAEDHNNAIKDETDEDEEDIAREMAAKRRQRREKSDINEVILDKDKGERPSLYSLLDSPIYFDSHRAAILVVLGCAMLSPISLALTGERGSGKTTILDAAKILVRDIVDTNMILLSDLHSDSSTFSVLASIVQKFILRRTAQSSLNRHGAGGLTINDGDSNMIFDYYSSLCFPSFHLHCSDCRSGEISEHLALLLRDHVILMDVAEKDVVLRKSYSQMPSSVILPNSIYPETLQSFKTGCASLSDCSFIIECDSFNSEVAQNAALTIKMPPLTEPYLRSLFLKMYPHHTESWIFQFINGYFLIKGSLPIGLINSFTIFDRLKNYSSFLMQDPANISDDMLATIESYQTMGKPPGRLSPDSITGIVKANRDRELSNANIHSLFGALRNLSETNLIVLQGIIERFASLSILGYLDDEADNVSEDQMTALHKQQLAQKSQTNSATPWSDARLLVKGNFILTTAWEQYILNQSLNYMTIKREQGASQASGGVHQTANNKASDASNIQVIAKSSKSDAADAQASMFRLGNQYMVNTLTSHHVTEIDLGDSPVKLLKTLIDRPSFLALNYRSTNPFWFAHLMSMAKLYGQDLDPFIMCRALEAFLITFTRRELNLAKLNCLLTYGISIRSGGSMSALYGEDPMFPTRLHVLKHASICAARILAYAKITASRTSKDPAIDISNDPQQIVTSLCTQDMNPQDREIIAEVVDSLENEIKVAEDIARQEHEDGDEQTQFDGFPLLTMLSMKPNKAIIRIDNAPSSSYNQLVRLFAALGNYTILSSDRFKQTLTELNRAAADEDPDDAQSEISKGSSRSKLSSMSAATSAIGLSETGKKSTQQRILIDVTTILSHLDGQTIMRTKRPPRGEKKESKENLDLIENLKKMIAELQSTSLYNSDTLDFLALIMILRVSFAMALGIKPEILLSTKASTNTVSSSLLNLGFNVNSSLTTSLPNRVIGTGRGISQLPFAITSWSEYMLKIEQYSKLLSEDHVNLDEVDIAPQGNDAGKQVTRDAIMSKFLLHSPMNVMIMTPMSTLMRASPTGVTAYSLLCRSLEPLNVLQSIFDEEEVQCLCNLATFGLGLDIVADSRILVSILSLTLSVVIIDDFPLNCADKITSKDITIVSSNECMRAKVLGSVKSPVLELVTNLMELHKEMCLNRAAKKVEETAQAQANAAAKDDGKLALVRPQAPDTPVQMKNFLEVMLQKRLQECNVNIITMSKLDLLSLFQLSDCKLPTEIVLPTKVNIDWSLFHHTFMVASVGVYRFCSANSINACPSMSVFTYLASQICNTILSKVADFMSILNTLFIALRLYEALASPSKTKPKLIDVTDLSPDSVAKTVDQAVKAQVAQDDKGNDSTSKRQRDLITAIAEAVVMRDLVHTCVDALKTDFRVMASAARSAALDSVAIAASLLFSIPGLVTESTARDALTGGAFGDIPMKLLKLLDQSTTSADISCFNVMIVALYSSLGFGVDLPDVATKEFGFDENSPIPICNATIQYGQFAFIGHLVELLGADWPMLTLLKGFRIPWSMGDPAMLGLYSVAIRYITGSTVFCVDETLGLAAACFLEACKKQAAQGTSYYEQVANVIVHGMNPTNPRLNDVTSLLADLQKRVLVIDMRMPSREFSTALARGLSTGEYTFLFINIESFKTDTSNYTTLRKFMVLRSRKTIGKRQTIAIGSVTAITAQALHKYTIIFALGRGMNLSDVLINAGLFTQHFIDNIAVCTQYSSPDRVILADTETALLQGQKHIMSQIFLESIFGESEGIRSRNERYRLNNVRFSHMINSASDQVKSYLMVYVLNLSTDKVSQLGTAFVRSADPVVGKREMEQAAMNQMVTQLTGSSDTIQHVCFTASFVLHASSSRKTEVNQLLAALKGLILLQQERCSILSNGKEREYKLVDTPVNIRCAIFDIVNTYGQALSDDIALAVNAVIYYLRKIAIYHIPALIGYSRDFFIIFKISMVRAITSFQEHLKEKYAKDSRFQHGFSDEYMLQNGLVSMQDENILAFCIKYDPGTLKNFLMSVMIPVLEARLVNIFPPELLAGIWHLIHILFSTAIGDLSGINKERPHPINPLKENVTAPALSLFAVLRSSVKDLTRLLTSQQIMGAFYMKSKFALTKIDVDNSDADVLNDIKHLIPEVTSMSPKVITSWIFFCLLGRYNPLIANSLTWFLKHHAAFVCFSRCEQPFASVLAFYARASMAAGQHSTELTIKSTKDTEKRSPLQQWYSSLMQDAMASNYQVFKLPPMLAKQDNQSFFAIFSLSNALKPELIIDTFEAMAVMLEKRCGPSAWQLSATMSVNAAKGITGHIRGDMKASSPAERGELVQACLKAMGIPFRNLLLFVGLPTKTSVDEDIEMPPDLMCDGVLQLYDVYTFSFKVIERYNAKVREIDNNPQILKDKKMQYIMAMGPSPIQVSLIFYDNIISIDHVFTFIHLLPSNPHRAVRANFAKYLSFQDITESVTVAMADPALGGAALLQDIVNVLKQKLSVRKYDATYPIFIFVPSSFLSPSALRANHSSPMSLAYADSEYFNSLLYEVSILTIPNYVYIQHPNTLGKAFVHYLNLCIIGITLLILVGFKIADLSALPDFQPPVTMRGMVLLALKHSFLSYQSTMFMDDVRLFYKLKKVLLRALTKQAHKYDKTSFKSCAFTNLTLLRDNGAVIMHRIDAKQYDRVSKVIINLNFGQIDALSKIIPTRLIVSEQQVHDEVVMRLLKETMRVKAQKAAKKKLRLAGSSDSEGDELSSSTSLTESVTSLESSKTSTQVTGMDGDGRDGDFVGFDDGDSIAGSDNLSSRGSSITTRSRGTSILRNNQGAQSVARFEEDDIYETLLVTIQIAAGDLTDERPIDAKKIEDSVRKLVEIEHRSLNTITVPNLAAERASGTVRAGKFTEWLDILPFYNDISDIVDLVQQLHLYAYNSEGSSGLQVSRQKRRLVSVAQHDHPQEFYYRHLFSSGTTLNTLSTVINPNFPSTVKIANDARKMDLSKMTSALRTYVMAHEDFKRLPFGSSSRNLSSVYILKHIIPNVGLPDMFTVDGTVGFGSFPTHWIINVSTYGPILGDILNFVRMHSAVLTSTPINRQRIVVSIKKPSYAPQIREDGTIDTETKSADRQNQCPFYVVLRNLELFRISYDTVLETVCADTVEKAQGYNSCLELYAYCVITSNTTIKNAPIAGSHGHTHLRVPANMVPVPIKIGGRIQPVVYLPNKTNISSKEWLERNPFFGVRFI